MNRRNFLLLTTLTPLFAKDYITTNNDIVLDNSDLQTLYSLDSRLHRLRRFVGYANFNIISFDTALYYARNYSAIGKFSKNEIALVEKLFYCNPNTFGFYGDKTVSKVTHTIKTKEILKISHSGHYIFKGKPHDDYQRLLKDVRSDLILTSGIRNVVKQLSLYTTKILHYNGNISKASTVIAPPAYSYHTIHDFDIGKKGWGNKNFTSAFATTKEFHEIRKLHYIDIRYKMNNNDGVRYEPWHIKVI